MSQGYTPPPLPGATERWALFLDFDGTLVEIAPEPNAVQVPGMLLPLLTALQARLQGALAIVTGRQLHDVDYYLQPLRLAGAGLHGAQVRESLNGSIEQMQLPADGLGPFREWFNQIAAGDSRLLVEDKNITLALHFRKAPERETHLLKAVRERLQHVEGYHVQQGKMVLELKPVSISKGNAVRGLMRQYPFSGRVPVFIGDDMTDEDGFQAVNDLNGISVKVGEGSSTARYRIQDVRRVLCWLKGLAGRHE